jgi:hypothetical protein
MRDRSTSFALGAALMIAVIPSRSPVSLAADDVGPRPRPFRIQVVEEGTGRGVPLVELRTVNQIRYVTDSNGIVAFDEPGFYNQKVFFSIRSHGYEVDKDSVGFRGAAFLITEGGSAQVVIRRRNIARRLYRVTGAGIYRDSTLTGDTAPIREPLMSGQVVGQDSVLNAVFHGKVYWFWGDTNRPDYPLGNFHVPGATSALPGHGGLEPEIGVDFSYFVDEHGVARPTAPMPGEGPTWLSGLVVLKDREKGERMFATYAKVRKQLEVYERGLAEFDPRAQRFGKVVQFPEAAKFVGEYPDGHPFLHREHGIDYVYYANPFPVVRVPAQPEMLKQPGSWEAYSCLAAGTRASGHKLDRGPDGVLRYDWKTNTQLLRQEQQERLIGARQIARGESLFNLRDIDSGKTVVAHGGSVYWNSYRQRWVMIAVESVGGTSFLGEIWFAEGDTPLGPWVYARKIVTHDKYSFYNPKQHPMFDKDNGRIIFFEGTYATTFSGNPDATPRYDYNQIMYQLDLSDRRLALPVAIYETPFGPGVARLIPSSRPAETQAIAPRKVAFFAPDREGIATLPVYEQHDASQGPTLTVGSHDRHLNPPGSAPLFFILRADITDYTSATVPLYEYQSAGGNERVYSVDARAPNGRTRWTSRVLGRVWSNPARLRMW